MSYQQTFLENLAPCETCVVGKQCRLPFPNAKLHKAIQPLQLIHADWGPTPFSSYLGVHHSFSTIDDFNWKNWVYFLTKDNEAFDKI